VFVFHCKKSAKELHASQVAQIPNAVRGTGTVPGLAFFEEFVSA
jgi:hypothetical protein